MADGIYVALSGAIAQSIQRGAASDGYTSIGAELTQIASVLLTTIGAVAMDEGRDYAAFQYDPEFARSGIEISPLTMPLAPPRATVPLTPCG